MILQKLLVKLLFFLHFYLFVKICVIQLIKAGVLADLVIKRNDYITTLKKSHTGLTVGYESKLCLRYADNLCHLGAVRVCLLQKCYKLTVFSYPTLGIVLVKIPYIHGERIHIIIRVSGHIDDRSTVGCSNVKVFIHWIPD